MHNIACIIHTLGYYLYISFPALEKIAEKNDIYMNKYIRIYTMYCFYLRCSTGSILTSNSCHARYHYEGLSTGSCHRLRTVDRGNTALPTPPRSLM